MRALLTAAVMTVTVTGLASAQYVASQDSSLRGLTRVMVRFRVADGTLNPVIKSRLAEYLTLELRKAGLRLTDGPEELKDDDGVLDVSLAKIDRDRTCDLNLRLSLEQRSSLKRTGQSLWMATWYYETGRQNVLPDSAADGVLEDGVNRFLNRWLAMNGR